MTIHIRTSTEADLPDLVKLLNEAYRESYEFKPLSEEYVQSQIQEGRFKVLVAENEGRFLGTVTYNDGHWGEEIRWLVVPKSENRRAMEDLLVKEAENHVKRDSVFTSIDIGSPETDVWVEHGYTAEGGLYHMVALLDGVKPLREVPEDVVIRCLRHGEEKAFVEAANAGFGFERVKLGSIEDLKNESPPFDEEWIYAAELDRIIAVVVSSPDTYYNRFWTGKRGYLGPAATLPEHRNKNLATILTQQAMNFLFEKGMNSAALYTSERNVATGAFLPKLGFNVGHHWKFMRKKITREASVILQDRGNEKLQTCRECS
jgi:ribosomal protein S18 acetylase RimI-like enzyme